MAMPWGSSTGARPIKTARSVVVPPNSAAILPAGKGPSASGPGSGPPCRPDAGFWPFLGVTGCGGMGAVPVTGAGATGRSQSVHGSGRGWCMSLRHLAHSEPQFVVISEGKRRQEPNRSTAACLQRALQHKSRSTRRCGRIEEAARRSTTPRKGPPPSQSALHRASRRPSHTRRKLIKSLKSVYHTPVSWNPVFQSRNDGRAAAWPTIPDCGWRLAQRSFTCITWCEPGIFYESMIDKDIV